MFINRILQDYSHCVEKLEHTRSLLYDTLRSEDEYTYSQEANLKRRVTSWRGSAAAKLACDIHTLLTMLNGEGCASIKDMVSNSKKPRRRKSVARPAATESSVNCSVENCKCKAEIDILKETVSSLQADMLTLKQEIHLMRHTSVYDDSSLKGDISEMKQAVIDLNVNYSSVNDRVISLENFISHDDIVTITRAPFSVVNEEHQPSGDSLEDPAAPFSVVNEEHQPSGASLEDPTAPFSVLHEDHQPSGASLEDPAAPAVYDPGATNESSPLNCETNVFVDDSRHISVEETDDETAEDNRVNRVNSAPLSQSHATIPTRVTPRDNRRTRDDMQNLQKQRSVTFADIIANIGTPMEPRVNGVPIRDETPVPEIDDIEQDIDDFSVYVRKRSKRFYVGGFKNTITERKLRAYVTSRGQTVTMVRIFPSKRNRNGVVISYKLL